ncbi:hypothetical protein BpHYR1_004073 [Brachionus plicatilis]|uniref:Uncharacterized protein n=1 Tax=Brachionus plicatilis TaxID=10195 RepID=A0A3M7PTD7_BRAPC|nr:hypothetical protein BpHYR1_004073 [Brachionus plicatilis]
MSEFSSIPAESHGSTPSELPSVSHVTSVFFISSISGWQSVSVLSDKFDVDVSVEVGDEVSGDFWAPSFDQERLVALGRGVSGDWTTFISSKSFAEPMVKHFGFWSSLGEKLFRLRLGLRLRWFTLKDWVILADSDSIRANNAFADWNRVRWSVVVSSVC